VGNVSNKIDAKGFFEDDSNWDVQIKPLPKNAKGFKIFIQPGGRGVYMYNLYVDYINGKFYITKMIDHNTSSGDCIYTLAKKIPLPKVIDVDTFMDLMRNKRNTEECLNMRLYGEKGFNQKLYDKIMKE
jgi:hypothetical protein